jgi:hypothetical protein
MSTEQVQGRCRLASFRSAEASNSTPDTCIIMSNIFLAPAMLGRCVYRLQPTGRTNSSYPGPATTTTARARAALQKSVARPPRAQHVVTGDGDEKEGVWASGDGDWREREKRNLMAANWREGRQPFAIIDDRTCKQKVPAFSFPERQAGAFYPLPSSTDRSPRRLRISDRSIDPSSRSMPMPGPTLSDLSSLHPTFC